MFGWVDFSDSERKRASEILELVKLPGAIDEFGDGCQEMPNEEAIS